MNTTLVYIVLCALVMAVAFIFYLIGRVAGYKACHDKNYFKQEGLSAEPPTDNEALTLSEYQDRAMTTCLPSCANFSYMFLNLVGELGELASKIGKELRKENYYIHENHLNAWKIDEGFEEELKKEAGDILWQLSGLCTVMCWKLADVAQQNLDKLASRKQRGVIDGNGDNR